METRLYKRKVLRRKMNRLAVCWESLSRGEPYSLSGVSHCRKSYWSGVPIILGLDRGGNIVLTLEPYLNSLLLWKNCLCFYLFRENEHAMVLKVVPDTYVTVANIGLTS